MAIIVFSNIHQTNAMLKKATLLPALLAVISAAVAAQTPTPEVKKNERPAATPAPVVEPFDKSDVKAMAAKCVTLDTEAGSIEMELYPEHAPETVRNFLNLTAQGLFDTTTFSRVVKGFVIQGGDIWTRTGGVNYAIGTRARRTIPDEPNRILHERGVVSMARGDEANTATTNFFILVDKASYLDGKFAAFGRVTRGMDVVDAINKVPAAEEKPEKPVRIRKAAIAECSVTAP
jgi:peptidyl-prolyl cis-trans isomerase B (cyclophilin B)